MKLFLVLTVIFLGIYDAAAVTHSLQYFYTGSSGVPGFPEFVAVGLVDGQQIVYHDSVIKKTVPKQDWMAKNEGPAYWERQTQTAIGTEQTFKGNIEILKPRFNQTGGVHILQFLVGCEVDETGAAKGKLQYAYDGEDFISFDLDTQTWIAPKPESVITKHKWDQTKAESANAKNYLTQICPEWVKKYVTYGRSSLMRTVLPSVSFLRKTSSSPVTCHATGFYPNRADLIWRKDGEELHEGVEKGEMLPNNDGSFQMSVHLDLSSVAAEDWEKYDCVFQLSGEEDKITTLKKAGIRSNEGNSLVMIILIVVAAVVLAAVAVIGFILYKQKEGKRPPSPVDDRGVQQQMMAPEATDS